VVLGWPRWRCSLRRAFCSARRPMPSQRPSPLPPSQYRRLRRAGRPLNGRPWCRFRTKHRPSTRRQRLYHCLGRHLPAHHRYRFEQLRRPCLHREAVHGRVRQRLRFGVTPGERSGLSIVGEVLLPGRPLSEPHHHAVRELLHRNAAVHALGHLPNSPALRDCALSFSSGWPLVGEAGRAAATLRRPSLGPTDCASVLAVRTVCGCHLSRIFRRVLSRTASLSGCEYRSQCCRGGGRSLRCQRHAGPQVLRQRCAPAGRQPQPVQPQRRAAWWPAKCRKCGPAGAGRRVRSPAGAVAGVGTP